MYLVELLHLLTHELLEPLEFLLFLLHLYLAQSEVTPLGVPALAFFLVIFRVLTAHPLSFPFYFISEPLTPACLLPFIRRALLAGGPLTCHHRVSTCLR